MKKRRKKKLEKRHDNTRDRTSYGMAIERRTSHKKEHKSKEGNATDDNKK